MNKRIISLTLALMLVLGLFAGCGSTATDDTAATPTVGTVVEPTAGNEPVVTGPKQAQYNTTTNVMPSNWNEFTYGDNNDTQILNYITSSFFEYDYKFEDDKKFNEDGSINKEGLVPGAYTTNYSAATKLEDITATVDAKWGYTDEQKAEGGYAW